MASNLKWLLKINWSWLQLWNICWNKLIMASAIEMTIGEEFPSMSLENGLLANQSEKTCIEQQILNWFTNGPGRYLPLIGSLTKFLNCLKFLDEESLFASKIVYLNMVILMQSSCKSFESKIIFEMVLLVYRKCITG